MKKYLLFSSVIFLLGCSSSSHFLTPGVNLNNYKYVYIALETYDSDIIETLVSKLFSQEGLIVLTINRVRDLSQSEVKLVLFCSVNYDNGFPGKASIRIYDVEEKLLYIGEGSFDGIDIDGSGRNAVEEAFGPFAELYTGFKH